MIFDLPHKGICLFKNLFIFLLNVFGAIWNFIYKLFVPKKKRSYHRMWRKRAYVR